MVRTPARIGVLCLIALLATSVVAAGAVAANPGSGVATALQDNGTSDDSDMTDDGGMTADGTNDEMNESDGMNDSDEMDGSDGMNDGDEMNDDSTDDGDSMSDEDADMNDGGDDALGTPGLAIVGFLAVAGVVGLVAVRRRG